MGARVNQRHTRQRWRGHRRQYRRLRSSRRRYSAMGRGARHTLRRDTALQPRPTRSELSALRPTTVTAAFVGAPWLFSPITPIQHQIRVRLCHLCRHRTRPRHRHASWSSLHHPRGSSSSRFALGLSQHPCDTHGWIFFFATPWSHQKSPSKS